MPKTPQFCDACFTGDYPLVLTDLEADASKKELAMLAHTDD